MSFDPILNAPFIIQFHIVVALLALVLGPVALWRKRRDRLHKITGYVWVLAMAAVALSSFGISSHFTPIGLGPIHLLSVYALLGLYQGMRAIYDRDIKAHKLTMENLYVRGVALAGAFNFLPDRRFSTVLIPEAEMVGYVVIAVVVVWAFWPMVSRIGSPRQEV